MTTLPSATTRDIDGLFVRTIGQGPPMLVVHGGLGFDQTYLYSGLDPLADQLTLVYLDLTGNGRSARPTTPEGWSALTFDRWAQDVESVRTALGFDDIFLLGHSLGGVIAQVYARNHASHVRGLVLCTTMPAFDFIQDAVARAVTRATPEQRDVIETRLGGPIASDEEFAEIMPVLLPLYFHNPAHPSIDRDFAQMRYSAKAYNQSFLGDLPGFASMPWLPSLDMPTLVVSGDDDWIGPLDATADRFAALLPHATTAIVAGSGHFPFLEQPDRFQSIMRDWLASIPER